MYDLNTPYRHFEFTTPAIAPFDSAGVLLWPTLVAEFLRPVIDSAEMAYWFCNHGADFQFCFAHNDFQRIEQVVASQVQAYQTSIKVTPTRGATIGTAFQGSRWLAANKIGDAALAGKRSQLVLQFLHATSSLYLDTLVRQGGHWKPEPNGDQQNPLGSNFESLLHLVANISQAEFDVYLSAQTAWMQPRVFGTVRCNL